MRHIICNAFSLNMLNDYEGATTRLVVHRLYLDEARRCATSANAEVSSAVGHADTAAVFSGILGVPVPCNRTTVTVDLNTQLLVGQYSGPRLPEGATSLPDGAEIKWYLVEKLPIPEPPPCV